MLSVFGSPPAVGPFVWTNLPPADESQLRWLLPPAFDSHGSGQSKRLHKGRCEKVQVVRAHSRCFALGINKSLITIRAYFNEALQEGAGLKREVEQQTTLII